MTNAGFAAHALASASPAQRFTMPNIQIRSAAGYAEPHCQPTSLRAVIPQVPGFAPPYYLMHPPLVMQTAPFPHFLHVNGFAWLPNISRLVWTVVSTSLQTISTI